MVTEFTRLSMREHRNDLILVAEYQIDRGLDKIARQISKSRTTNNPPMILGVLNGAFMITSELVKRLHIECYVDFCRVSSYPAGPELKKVPELTCEPKLPVNGLDVYVVEDIVDTGDTVNYLKDWLYEAGANNVYIVSLIKRTSDTTNLIDYYGVEIGDDWVYGYGLDDNELRRNYRNIYAIQ